MGEIIPIFGSNNSLSIKYSDVFSMKALYQFVREWLLEGGYIDESSEKWMETYYYENISQTSGKELVVYWRTQQNSQSKFVKYHLHIDFRVLAMKDVETMVKGKKVKANQGEVEIIINGFMEQDPEGTFGKSFFLTDILMNFFKKRMYKTNLEEIKKNIILDVQDLQAKIKQFLEMYPITPAELFRSKRGL
jgi:hypothetical protein